MIYVYAVTEPLTRPPPPLAGMYDQPTELLLINDIGIAISRHSGCIFTPTADHVYRHEHVVEALMKDRAVLPARFGTTFREEHDIQHLISVKTEVIRAALDRVRGCVELGVRVLVSSAQVHDPPEPAPAMNQNSGRAWMLARLDRERKTERDRLVDQALATSLHEPLTALARDACLRLHPDRFLMTAAYLVPRDRTDDFATEVQSLASKHPQLRLLCTGPWPPYNFAPTLCDATNTHA